MQSLCCFWQVTSQMFLSVRRFRLAAAGRSVETLLRRVRVNLDDSTSGTCHGHMCVTGWLAITAPEDQSERTWVVGLLQSSRCWPNLGWRDIGTCARAGRNGHSAGASSTGGVGASQLD